MLKNLNVNSLIKLCIVLLIGSFSLLSFGLLKNKTNGEWATITGKVTSVKPDYFYLKSKGNSILIEMDDFDMDADGYKLVKGDEVVATGRVDHDLFETKKLEASSVYVQGIDTTFYASAADEEDIPVISTSYYVLETLPEGATADIQGTVTRVGTNEFVVDTGLRKLTVETEGLRFNPLDDVGLVQIDKGDRVRVSGVVDNDFLEGKEIKARYILEI